MTVIRKMQNGCSVAFLIGYFDGEYVWTCDHKKATDFSNLSIATINNYAKMLQKTYKKATIEGILV